MNLPARFKRFTLLVVGCGDIGVRVLRALPSRIRVLVLTSSPARVQVLRELGATPIAGDLDRLPTLQRLAGLADAVLHLAPPSRAGRRDERTASLLRALVKRAPPRRIVYASTTGVYGDCAGARIDETRALRPTTARAQRRADAEAQLRWYARAFGFNATLLRVPGIYAADRAGGDPRARVAAGTAVLAADEDVFTNHIHADDLARACIAALWRGRPQRVLNVNDDTELRTGDWFDLVADLAGLPRPPRVSRAQAQQLFSAERSSFLGESRRLDNTRMKRELRLRLRYPSGREALAALRSR